MVYTGQNVGDQFGNYQMLLQKSTDGINFSLPVTIKASNGTIAVSSANPSMRCLPTSSTSLSTLGRMRPVSQIGSVRRMARIGGRFSANLRFPFTTPHLLQPSTEIFTLFWRIPWITALCFAKSRRTTHPAAPIGPAIRRTTIPVLVYSTVGCRSVILTTRMITSCGLYSSDGTNFTTSSVLTTNASSTPIVRRTQRCFVRWIQVKRWWPLLHLPLQHGWGRLLSRLPAGIHHGRVYRSGRRYRIDLFALQWGDLQLLRLQR